VSTTAFTVERPRRLAFRRIDVAIVAFTVLAALMAWGLAVAHGRTFALLALVPCLAAVALRMRPVWAAGCIGLGATMLRLFYMGIGSSTQIDNARAAAERAFGGASPYGVLIPSTTWSAEPYIYGPLGLLWWQPGVAVELAAAVAVTVLLIRTRSWLTLAAYSGLPFSIYLTTTGVNDYSPGFLIAAALLLVRTRPVAGAGLLGVAAAVKPYAFAWFLPVIGYGGWQVAAALGATTAVLWSPLIAWGPIGFLRSVQLVGDLYPAPANALNVPLLRWAAVPLALVGLLARRWDHAVLIGAAVFVTYLFFSRWASLGYWLAVIPAAGIAIEDLWMRHSSATATYLASTA
jgi:hypothetical protein